MLPNPPASPPLDNLAVTPAAEDDARRPPTAGHSLQLLDELVLMQLEQVPRRHEWQRVLRAKMQRVHLRLQALRLTVSVGRPNAEILSITREVAHDCSRALRGLTGNRVDADARAPIHFAADLAARLLQQLTEADAAGTAPAAPEGAVAVHGTPGHSA